jgi:hypothetical protein
MADLGTTGNAIWQAYGGDQLDSPSAALILELARCADTCDRLNDLVVGRAELWAMIVFDDMGEVNLVIDKLLDQRRNHQLALKALVAEVRAAKIPIQAGTLKTKAPDAPEDMLARLRQEKEQRERQLG